ncbi:MAG: ComEC family competence protein, partial [Chloroflexaceae bacterium]|nr:ComEC family competence protein [Chloroflexaceae bacterium]
MTLALLSIAWMLGIVVADRLPVAGSILVGGALCGMVWAVLAWRVPPARLAGLLLLMATLGALRYQAALVAPEPQSVWLLPSGSPVSIAGLIHEEPRRSETGQRVVMRAQAAALGGNAAAVEGLVLLNLPTYPTYTYGQYLIVHGSLEPPPAAARPGLFDYREYLARRSIFVLMEAPDVERLPQRGGNPLLVALGDLRRYCNTLLIRNLPEPQASVAAGMLLGYQATIPEPVYTAFRDSGTVHLLVISGWHLSLVAVLVAGLARRMQAGRSTTFWLALTAIWLYALFVGATGTVLRAAVMASLVALAAATERRAEPWTLLLAACLGLSLWNPQILWDLSFQLSALATAGLMAFGRPLQQWLATHPPFVWPGLGWAADVLAATLAAQAGVLPLLMYHFGNLSLIAPLANLLLVPAVPIAMLAGAVAMLAGLLVSPLAGLPVVGEVVGAIVAGGWLFAWLPLAFLTVAAEWLAALPGSVVQITVFPVWLLVLYYALVGAGYWLLRGSRAILNTAIGLLADRA